MRESSICVHICLPLEDLIILQYCPCLFSPGPILVPDPLWPSRSMKHRSHTQTHLFNLHRQGRNLLGWAEPALPSPFSHFSDFTPLSAPVAAAGTLRAERCDPCSGQHSRAGAHLMQLHHTRISPAACGVQRKQLS